MSLTPATDRFRLFQGVDDTPAGRIDLGDDADNVRFDAAADHLLVGYGNGAIAIIDAAQQKKIGDFALPAHPESFQIASVLNKVFVNVPGAHALVVLNGLSGSQMRLRIREGGNFPMALDTSNGRVLIVSRNPPKLSACSAHDGTLIASTKLAATPMISSSTTNAARSTSAAAQAPSTYSTRRAVTTIELPASRL